VSILITLPVSRTSSVIHAHDGWLIDTVSSASPATGTKNMGMITGMVKVGSVGGDVSIRMRSETNNKAVTLYSGSILIVEEIL
jgi:hypothetical protein